jgi:hypothetical protein
VRTGRDATPPQDTSTGRWLGTVAAFLATGSTLLLLTAVIDYPFLAPRTAVVLILRVILIVPAVWLYLFAWAFLFLGTRAKTHDELHLSQRRRDRTALVLGMVFFGAALATVPYQLPFARAWVPSLLLLAIPYLPLVFSPVVLSHAYIYFKHADPPVNRRFRMARIGALLLVAISILSVLGQVAYYAGLHQSLELAWWTFLPFPAGLTASGYWLQVFAWRGSRLRGASLVAYGILPESRG